MRLEVYLDDVKVTSQFDPAALKARAEMAARSLGIKINESCFSKPADQQASCLSQNSEGMVLDDTNAQSLVDQLANGNTLNLMNAISSTTMAGGGAYSPYIGAIVDTARILSSLHTAHFQYIPALALPRADSLNLRLNMPPSFINPKSVVVVALPPIGPSRPEPLHPVKPGDSFCAMKPELVLPAEGAPLVFATAMAHDLYLHIESGGAKSMDVQVTADSARGGLVLSQPISTPPGGELTAVLRGKWGFDNWEGPRYQMVGALPGRWTLAASDQSALVVGRDDTLHIDGPSTVCVEKVEARTAGNRTLALEWKSPRSGVLEVTAPLKDATPGAVSVAVYQFGLAEPDRLTMEAYDAAASLEGLALSAGDESALLKGTRLDEVAKAEIDGIALTPGVMNRAGDLDELLMTAGGSTASLVPGKRYVAHVSLRDGRKLTTPVTVDPPRPQVMLLSKGVQNDASAAQPPVQLGSADDFPIDERLVFFLKSIEPRAFPRDEKVEVAADDSSFHTMLTLTDGGLMLEDAHTVVGSLEPLARFGSSAFGPVRVRAISADGTPGDWLPLGTLVRLPGFNPLRCPRLLAKPCVLGGSNLFLAATFAATPDFDDPADVPPHFTGTQLTVPHPVNGVLYFKLRDDPATVQTLTLAVTPMQTGTQPNAPTAQPAAPAASPQGPTAQGAPGQESAPNPQ
jgi:hypothetical protein